MTRSAIASPSSSICQRCHNPILYMHLHNSSYCTDCRVLSSTWGYRKTSLQQPVQQVKFDNILLINGIQFQSMVTVFYCTAIFYSRNTWLVINGKRTTAGSLDVRLWAYNSNIFVIVRIRVKSMRIRPNSHQAGEAQINFLKFCQPFDYWMQLQ